MGWWNELTELQKIFASVAIPATLFMVLQFVLLLFGFANGSEADGADAPGDLNIEDGAPQDIFDGSSHEIFDGSEPDVIAEYTQDAFDGHPHDILDGHSHDGSTHDRADTLRLFTVRGIIAFLSVGGWMGVAAIDWNLSAVVAIVLAVVAGGLALYFVAWIIRVFLRLQQSGNISIENAIGKEGEVYIPISHEGRGKVSVVVQERLREIDATTNAGRVLKTGEKVDVIGVAAEGVLLVAPKSSPEEVNIEKII